MKGEPNPIGLKIRQARIRRGLTQEELAGGEITRNMMCRIETGTASPSRSTLTYLADRLDLPLLYLLDDSITLDACLKLQHLPHIRTELDAGHYAEVVRLIRKYFTEPDDELAYLAAYSLTELAKKAVFNGNLDTADRLVREALAFTEKTVYPTEHLHAPLLLLRAVCRNVQSPRYEIDDEHYLQFRNQAVMQDFFAYLTDNPSACSNKAYLAHMEARTALKARDYKKALSILQELEARRGEAEVGAILLFRIYTDIEVCYREMDDYQGAYRYAGKRISMLSAFKS